MSSAAYQTQSSRHPQWIVVGIMLGVGLAAYATLRVMIGDSDLIGFHETAVHLWQTGELTPDMGWKFYLPGAALLVLPLVVWPMWLTAPLWGGLNVIALWWTVRESARLAAADGGEHADEFHVRWTLPACAVFVYAADSISLGQFNLLVLALCVAAYSRSRRKGGEWIAGVLAGLAAAIKLYPLILIGFWCVRGQWKASVSAALSFILIAGGASLGAFGWKGSVEAHRAWFDQTRGTQYLSQTAEGAEPAEVRHLMFTAHAHTWMRHNNQSLAAVARRLLTELPRSKTYPERPVNVADLNPRAACRVYVAGAAILFACLLVATWRSRRKVQVPGVFAAWMALVIAFVPVYWTHYFVLVLPAVSLLCRSRRQNRWAHVLLLVWIAGEALLGSRFLRLVGLQCWLTLAVALWALHYHRREPQSDVCAPTAQQPA